MNLKVAKEDPVHMANIVKVLNEQPNFQENEHGQFTPGLQTKDQPPMKDEEAGIARDHNQMKEE